jgi:hypothetical protein
MSKPSRNRPAGFTGKFRNNPSNLLTINFFMMHEYLVHYLQLRRTSISRSYVVLSRQIFSIMMKTPHALRKELEVRFVFFDPATSGPPEILFSTSLNYFLKLSGQKYIRPEMAGCEGYCAIQVCRREDAPPLKGTSNWSRTWILLTERQLDQLSKDLLFQSPFFDELYFETQVQEVFRLYGGKGITAPSLN